MTLVFVFSLLVFCNGLPVPWATDFPNITCSPVGRGLNASVPLCSASNPCVHLLSTYAVLGITTISVEDYGAPGVYPGGQTQQCSTRIGIPVADARNDGPISSITLSDGRVRYFCKYEPAGTSLPLLIGQWILEDCCNDVSML